MNTPTKLINAEEWISNALLYSTREQKLEVIQQIQLNALEWAVERILTRQTEQGDQYGSIIMPSPDTEFLIQPILSQIAELKKGQQ